MALNNPYALSFDGVDDGIDLSNLSDVFPIDKGTFELWCKWNRSNSVEHIIHHYDGSGNRFYIRNSNDEIQVALGDSNDNIITYSDCPKELFHLALTWDNGNCILYINAQNVGNGNYTGLNDISSYLSLFYNKYNNSLYYTGIADEMRFWDYSLSQQEIQENMNKYLTGKESGLVAYYRCNEGTGTTLIDATGNGNDGTINGASYVGGLVDLELGYIDIAALPPTNVSYDSMIMNGELRGVGEYPTVDCKFQYSTNPEFAKFNDINNPYALSFDGNDYVEINVVDDIYCIEFWVYIDYDIPGAGYKPILGFINNYSLIAFGSITGGTSGASISIINVYPNITYVKDELSAGKHHLAFSWNGTSYDVYVNGNKLTTYKYNSHADLYTYIKLLGKRHGYSQYFKGALDEVRFWNIAKTEQEIQNNMNKCLTGNEKGLVAYYRCDEGIGDTLIDATGNGNDGTINGASYVPGEVQLDFADSALEIQETEPQTIKDTVLSFDGIDDYVEIPYNSSLEISSKLTVEFWTNNWVNGGSNKYIPIIGHGNFAEDSWHICTTRAGMTGEGEGLTFCLSGNTDSFYTYYIPTSEKTHCAFVYDGVEVYFYVNGILNNSKTTSITSIPSTTKPLYIGWDEYDNSNYAGWYQGELNEIRIWNYPRTQSEIQYYMNKKLTGDEEGLVAYYNCDNSNNDGTTLVDISGNGNDGTINGATYTETPVNLVLPVQFSQTLTGLDNSKPYYYRAVATTGGEMLDNYNPYSLSFDGIDDYVNTPLNFNGLTQLTIELRITPKNTITTTEHLCIFGACQLSWDNMCTLANWNGTKNEISCTFRNTQKTGSREQLTTLIQTPLNTETFVSFVYNNNNLKGYRNGILENQITNNNFMELPNLSEIISFSKPFPNNTAKFEGFIDEIRIWNRTLSQQEIHNNMNRRLTGDEEGLVAYYRCDKQVNHGVLIDSSGNDNHGTIYGATWVKN